MAEYRISGVWKSDDVITHYAFHEVTKGGVACPATKTSKAEAVKIVETKGNTVKTMLWNYSAAGWTIGEDVHVVDGKGGKFLRSNPDNKLTDNLEHLIDFDWIAP